MITTICNTTNEFHYKVLEKTLSSHAIGVSCKDDKIFTRFFIGFFFKCSDSFEDEWIAIDIEKITESVKSIACASKRLNLLSVLQLAIEGKKEEIGKIQDAATKGQFSVLDPMGGINSKNIDDIESGENPFSLLDLK